MSSRDVFLSCVHVGLCNMCSRDHFNEKSTETRVSGFRVQNFHFHASLLEILSLFSGSMYKTPSCWMRFEMVELSPIRDFHQSETQI